MDIAICVIDTDTFEMQYAGANNPVFILRKGNLTEFKPDKMPIGSHRLANPRVRGIRKIKIHVFLSLCAQVVKRIGAVMTQRLTKPKLHRLPCSSVA